MSRAWSWALWLFGCAILSGVLGWFYYQKVWLHPEATMTLVRDGVTYQLLSPRMLGIALIAPWFLIVMRASLADLPWQQKGMTVLLRIGFVSLLALALSRPVRSATTNNVCVVYLIDVSESVTDEALQDAQDEVSEAYDNRKVTDVIKVVTFARRPRLLVPKQDDQGNDLAPTIARHEAVGDEEPKVGHTPGSGTNAQAALQLAFGLYPTGYLRRAVLISDGLQTDGDLLAEAKRAKDHGVILHTHMYRRGIPGEVALRKLRIPDSVKVGETFAITAEIYASRETKATARLYQGETLNGLEGVKDVELKKGVNELAFKSVVRVAGEVTYALKLDDIGVDKFKENNHYATTVDVPGRPQVLYVEGTPQHASAFQRALTAQQFDVELRRPQGFPGSLKEFERFDFVVLSDTPKELISLEGQRLLEQYVRDLGGGFMFAGGEHGYGLGGWYNTTIARMLPVRMEVERVTEMPSVAMALVIDRSGSMQGKALEMAKAAAKATLDVLENGDLVEVIAYDSQPNRFVKMQPARNRSRIRSLIGQIQHGGGTDIFPALEAAYSDMTVTQARKKHVILLTDGKAPPTGIRDLVTAMIAEQITVTTVGLGDGVDEQLLKMIADVGGGRYHPVLNEDSLPRIFTKETEMIARAAAVEEWFPVEQVGYASFLKRIDVSSAPYLRGHVATSMKPTPAVELLSNADTQEPILARWRVGTGWVLAWTSDVKTRWAYDWVGWAGWERFWGQLVREHMRQKHRRELPMTTRVEGGKVYASVDAFTIDERFDNKLQSELTVTGPVPGGEERTVKMRQTAPGRYEAELPLVDYGSFLVRARHSHELDDGSLKPIATSFGHVSNPYPREYEQFEPDEAMLEGAALATDGVFEPKEPAIVFDPRDEEIRYNEDLWSRAVMLAIALYLFDLLLRRVRIFNRRFRSRRRTGFQAQS